MSDDNALFSMGNGGNSSPYGAGPTESEVRAAIDEIEAETPLLGAKRMLKQLCITLAVSIDKGNIKGRAIANEAGQLFVMMQQLAPPPDDAGPASDLSPETKALVDAFTAAPRFDSPPEVDDSPEL